MESLGGKVVVVSGAARGIGAATTRIFTAEGAAVVMLDLPSSQGEMVTEEISQEGGRVRFIPTDVRSESEVADAFGKIRRELRRLDTLVNVAGINRKGRIENLSVEDWEAVMDVNVRGMFLTIKHATSLMKESGGSTVNLSSVSAYVGTDGYAAYHTSKGAVLSLTRALALELAPYAFRVNAICPGWVDTPFSDEAIGRSENPAATREAAGEAHALGRMARPEEVAQTALFLASDGSSFVTGAPLFVDGGFMIKK